ncbi:hypothetical protein Taro_013996, partial [Colocasia esculenta]|nr:hypothetical protein [Colocasia esculenta]
EEVLGSLEVALGALELGGGGVLAYEKAHLGWIFILRNYPQKTTELFSFGRPKEEKLKSHHHPQR